MDFSNSDWEKIHLNYILEDNPDFKIDHSKTIDYKLIPLLLIHANYLEKDEINLLKYFDIAELTLDNAQLLVFNDEKLKAVFTLEGYGSMPFLPFSFSKYLYKRNITQAMESELNFRPCIKIGKALFFLGSICYYHNDSFYFLNSEDNLIYPAEELYRTLFPTEDKFRLFINELVEANRKEKEKGN